MIIKLKNIYLKVKYGLTFFIAQFRLRIYRISSSPKKMLSIIGGTVALTLILAVIIFVWQKPTPKKPNNAISPIVAVKNITEPANNSQAQPLDVLEWQKQIRVTPDNTNSDTSVIEKIPSTQDYQTGTLKLPPGWKAQWATTVNEPKEHEWQDTEPASGVTYIRLSTNTVTTTKPTAQSVLTKPVDQESIAVPPSMNDPKTAFAMQHDDKIYTIFQAVDVNDGVNDIADMTIGCLNLKTFNTCTENGVTFPVYMSSAAGVKLGDSSSPKDISTPFTFKAGFLDGKLYIPAQQGDNYGINCINLDLTQNCGFKAVGSSPAPSQDVGKNPTLISGFVQEGNKLYGHTNPDNNNNNPLDDFVQVFCFDMSTANNVCNGFEAAVDTPVPSLYRLEHGNAFYTPGQHVVVGDRYYFLMNYDEANTRLNNLASTYYTQTLYGNRLVCFSIVSKTMCDDWPTANPIYKAPVWECTPGCGYHDKRQTVYGAKVTESAAAAVGGAPVDERNYERPRQLFLSRNTDLSIRGLCVTIGMLSGADPGVKCYNLTNGSLDNSTEPSNFIPNQWMNVPWSPIFESTEKEGKLYSSWNLPANNALGYGKKSAVICYDWATQNNCDGFRKPHYWYEVNQADTQDVTYLPDGDCTIGVSRNNFTWSFNSETGETPCRQIDKNIKLSIKDGLDKSFCDGKSRNVTGGYLKFERLNLHDFRTLNITVKDKNNNVVGALNNVSVKDASDGKISLTGVNFVHQADELTVEVDGELNNTSPWGINPATGKRNYPLATVVFDTEPAQYCYQTKVKSYCDTAQAESSSDIKSITKNDLFTMKNTASLAVKQNPQVQCFKDLRVDISSDRSQVKSGEEITYTIKTSNLANVDASGRGNIPAEVTIEGTIPDNMTFVSATGGSVVDGNKIKWTNQSVLASQSKEKTITLRANAISANLNIDQSKVYAATTSTPIVFHAQAVYADDVNQTDNALSNNGVILINETPDNTNNEENLPQATDTPNTLNLPTSVNDNAPASDTSSDGDNTLTPRMIRNIIPPVLRGTVESFFRTLKSTVEPIPPRMAVAIPYGTIAFLTAFIVIYLYQSIQEKKTRNKLNASLKRYKYTEDLRRNYLDLTSHYLNTPIATMNSTIDLLGKLKELPNATVTIAHQRLQRLASHMQDILNQSQSISNQAKTTAGIISPILQKKKFLSIGLILPIIVVLLVAFVLNVIFIWAGKYTAATGMLMVQTSYYMLSVLAFALAFRIYRNQLYATEVAEQEVYFEKQLALSQSQFITNSSKTLTNDIIELDQLSPAVKVSQKGRYFTESLTTFKNAIAKLVYINALTNNSVVTTLPNQTIKDLATEVIDALRPYAGTSNVMINLNVESGLTVKIDKDGFKQILNSIVHNAIKFNHSGGKVDVIISRHDNNNIRLVVSDNGRGISEDKVGNLFSPFGRATDSKEYNFEGFGLDLYINKLIVEHNGGSIVISSEEGVGTTVTAVLSS